MALSPGDKLGPYEILAPIGKGGMGEVYRAKDTKLDREVAVKVLPAALAQDPERLARFEREAKVLASLNHPNIAQIYGVEDRALVMELVPGEPLKGPLSVETTLDYARQIAEALAAAHEKGIIHRDLKPANIMVTSEGVVKLLDFGLASVAPANSSTGDVANSPTITMGTQAGMILGTAAYMSPEQARGKTVDQRADIWAFGVVLYELVTGRRMFTGEDASEIMAAVIMKEPQWDGVPPTLQRMLRRCVEKDPKRRLRDIGDALSLVDGPATGFAVAAPSASRWPWLVAAFATLIALALAVPGWRQTPVAPTLARQILTIVPPSGTNLRPITSQNAPEISPDGSSVLEGRMLRRLDSLRMDPLGGMEGLNGDGFWSADSKSIVFPETLALKKMRVPDGAPEIITRLPSFLAGGSWSHKGTILISSGLLLWAVPSDGGELKQVEVDGLKQHLFTSPQFFPDSEDFLFSSNRDVYEATLQEGHAANTVLLFKNATGARYTPAGDGRVLFVRNDNLYAQRLDWRKRQVQGDPELVIEDVASRFSVSRAGVIAWRPGKAAPSQWTTFDRTGKQVGATGPLGGSYSAALSPDELHLAVSLGPSTWLMEPDKPGQLRVDPERGLECRVWSPDGLKLFCSSLSERALYEYPVSRAGAPRKLADQQGLIDDISPDGKLVLLIIEATTLYTMRLDVPYPERVPKLLVETDEQITNAHFSPDGRWILYRARKDGANGIFVQAFPGPGLRKQISGNGSFPQWRKDGKEIVYYDRDQIWSIPVEPSPGEQLRFGSPVALFSVRRGPNLTVAGISIAVSRDGSRIYFPQAEKQSGSNMIHLLSGWINEYLVSRQARITTLASEILVPEASPVAASEPAPACVGMLIR